MNIYALELARIPNVTLEIMQRLAKTMRRDAPEQSNVVIDEALAALDEEIARVDLVLVARVIANNPQLLTSAVDFDLAVDGLWVFLRRLLEGNEAYAHRGLERLPKSLAEKGHLAKLRVRAKRARRLWERLFGADGTKFVKLSYMAQAETMATLLRMLEQEGLRSELEEVVGPELPALLDACQLHYEDMVSERLGRQQKGENLTEARNDLRLAMIAYVNAVHSLYRPKQPETADVVLDALASVLSVREAITRAGGESGAEFDELVELELPEAEPELEAEAEQA
jgi:hypothetical protein